MLQIKKGFKKLGTTIKVFFVGIDHQRLLRTFFMIFVVNH